jgi:hypothetical protein
MNRILLCFPMLALALLAQTPDQPPPASPVPSTEPWLTGSIDLGYRWRTDVAGSFDTYRSVVNLGSGPKLLGSEFTIADPKKRLFDRVHVRAYSWGDEPYETVRVDAAKAKLYDFRADYRDLAYFNYLPSYADPLLGRGIVLNEQSFDTRRHLASFSLDLLPRNWIVPYLAFDHDSGSGTGATAFISDANTYPVPNRIRNSTNLYRGGVRFELRRFHATIEEGGTTFRDDESLFQNPGSRNYGNTATPFFGQKLDLTSLLAAYGIRGSSTYSKGLLTASPASWLDLYGQFLFSQPDTNVNYQQYNTGNILLQSQLLFYTGQQYLVSAAAKMPHTTGSAGAEIRPWRGLRITEAWLTDRLHNAGNTSSTNQFFQSQVPGQSLAAQLASSLVTNYNQNEIDIFFDPISKLTLRGGYRYVWGDASTAVLPRAGLVGAEQGTLSRNVGIAGFTFRPNGKVSVTGEAEGGASGGVYFRTSLYNYQKARAQVRYQATNSLNVQADFTLLKNQNPITGVNYDYRAVQESLSLLWLPAGGKFGDFQASYSRSDLRSDIGYLAPQNLTPQVSQYRDNAHTGTGLFDFKLPHSVKITAGGSFFLSSGSRPTSFFEPTAKLWVPVQKHAALFAEWSYYGYGEAFYLYEGFRTHAVVAGMRFNR